VASDEKHWLARLVVDHSHAQGLGMTPGPQVRFSASGVLGRMPALGAVPGVTVFMKEFRVILKADRHSGYQPWLCWPEPD